MVIKNYAKPPKPKKFAYFIIGLSLWLVLYLVLSGIMFTPKITHPWQASQILVATIFTKVSNALFYNLNDFSFWKEVNFFGDNIFGRLVEMIKPKLEIEYSMYLSYFCKTMKNIFLKIYNTYIININIIRCLIP